MHRRALAVAAATICATFLFSAVAVEEARAQAKVVNLKIANFFPPPSKQSKILQEFGEELERRSGDGSRSNTSPAARWSRRR
ncbi:MAG: hypothetical protein M5U08_15750 [Burkholderiales bacterium]|nr:hypothetical protein [Burkholderiales bacterium]